MKQLLKVLSNDMKPPIQGGDEYKLKKWYHCDNFDESDTECSCGFYAIPISELIHYHKPYKKTNVASVRVKGKEKTFEQITETANEHTNYCLNDPNKKLCQSCVSYTPNNYFKKCKKDIGTLVIQLKQCYLEPCDLWECKKSLFKHIDEGVKND